MELWICDVLANESYALSEDQVTGYEVQTDWVCAVNGEAAASMS